MSIALTVFVFAQSLDRQRQEAAELGSHLASVLDHELTLRETAVDGIVADAEHVLLGRAKPTVDVTAHLVAVPDKGGYALGVPPGYDTAEVGSLAGLGAIPAKGSAHAEELDMAFALSPGFRAVQLRNPDVPWAYYFSRRSFVYMVPRVGADDFFVTKALVDEHFQHRADHARGRRVFWTDFYEDRAGKGRVATVSKTVLLRGEVVGSVSVDVGVGTVSALLAEHRSPYVHLHLLSSTGVDMIGEGAPPGPVDVASAVESVPSSVGDAHAFVSALRHADWHVAVVTPRRAARLRGLRESLPYGLMTLFMLASLLLLMTLTRSLRDLAALSVRDALTGLYNRRHFDDVARVEISKTHRGSVTVGLAILDVDHFKAYNDRYGHHAGDQVLKAVAGALRTSLRRASDTLFRIGGEEFAVVVVVDRPDQMRALGEKLCAAVRALDVPHEGSAGGRVTISFGATTVDATRNTSFEQAYKDADAALYRAKAAGRDRVEA